ncbi:MAG: fructose-1,6-bisphosphatase [Oscillospiraceae bacterium]|nr:fructose-1,6-bisphosphatase [Oscillospiraceae bacterium]
MREYPNYSVTELEYLRLLAERYPTAQSAATEIINLKAILNLPKSTEHFMSDIHGEYEAFTHIMRSASGAIKEKIDLLFSKQLNEEERAILATLVYYPREKMSDITEGMTEEELNRWYRRALNYLIELCHLVASKYTRSKVRKALPEEYAYVIDELLNTDFTLHNKKDYYKNIITTIIDIGKAPDFIEAVCDVIKRLIVDRLHIVGDIYDRGPRADIVMESLMKHHSVDIQWGNHDIVWMGAAAGSRVCIATVLSNSIRYNNLYVVETGYGISLRSLAVFANEKYADTNTDCFKVISDETGGKRKVKDLEQAARMYKAITIMLFKLEGQSIKRNPDFHMEDRLLLEKINYKDGTVEIDGKTYELLDTDFPTIDPKDPYKLTTEELEVMANLADAFKKSEKLQKHIKFLLYKGSIYKCYNGNLLIHGAIPMDEEGGFKRFTYNKVTYSGKRYLDFCEEKVRDGYFAQDGTYAKQSGKDFMWFLWCGKNSPLYARDKITTFERRLIADKSTWVEKKDPYYIVTQSAAGCELILQEFGLGGKNSHIINGHVPVKASDGESPVKGEGKLIVIDGGFCKAYQGTTGIAGYTLIYNSYIMRLSSHEPFLGRAKAIKDNTDIHSASVVFERLDKRIKISETDIGKKLQKNIDQLTKLLEAYNLGIISENEAKNTN